MRFGDPECQGLMALCASDLTDAMLAATRGRLGDVRLDLRPEAALTVVLAARGYPGEYPKGSVIRGLEGVTGAKVFHAGTARNAAGEVVSAGGRVLNVTALGADVAEAQAKAYAVSRQGGRAGAGTGTGSYGSWDRCLAAVAWAPGVGPRYNGRWEEGWGYGSARRDAHLCLDSLTRASPVTSTYTQPQHQPLPTPDPNITAAPHLPSPPQAVKQIQWADAYYRSDIGWRAVERLRAGKH